MSSCLSGRDQTLLTGTHWLGDHLKVDLFAHYSVPSMSELPFSIGVSWVFLVWAGLWLGAAGRGHCPVNQRQACTATWPVLVLNCRWCCSHKRRKGQGVSITATLQLRLCSGPRGLLIPLLLNMCLEILH